MNERALLRERIHLLALRVTCAIDDSISSEDKDILTSVAVHNGNNYAQLVVEDYATNHTQPLPDVATLACDIHTLCEHFRCIHSSQWKKVVATHPESNDLVGMISFASNSLPGSTKSLVERYVSEGIVPFIVHCKNRRTGVCDVAVIRLASL